MNFDENSRNVFLYWCGYEYKLISILRNLIYLHSKNGKGYSVHLVTPSNIKEFIEIPDFFFDLIPAHQADYARINLICKYGGIWLDSDTLVLNSLDSLFEHLEKGDGFFILQKNIHVCSGVFGSKKSTKLMNLWNKLCKKVLNKKKNEIKWTEINGEILQCLYEKRKKYFEKYKIFKGLDNLYPVNWDESEVEFLDKPFENYKNIIREFQPLIILVNSIYRKLENCKQIINGNFPLNYFINKSFENMNHLIDYDFIEIGTSNFDTYIQSCGDEEIGISVDAVKYYVDSLPNKKNVKKCNLAISNENSTIDVYYVPENIIIEKNLPDWVRGCNRIGDFHPLHWREGITDLCVIEKIKSIPTHQLFYENKVKGLKKLKIDTEGHEIIILECLLNYIKNLPFEFYPKNIIFESNGNTKQEDVDCIVKSYHSIGYEIKESGHDTCLFFNY